jgi:hypothetical protein
MSAERHALLEAIREALRNSPCDIEPTAQNILCAIIPWLSPVPQANDGRPKLDDFDNQSDYMEAHARWVCETIGRHSTSP